MAMPVEEIQALADAVAEWRMQEYIALPFCCLYVYYILTTMAEEVRIIFPQRWNRGKMLYSIIRYGTLAHISLQLGRDYRNYFSITPTVCKVLYITYDAIRSTGYLECDFSLALCLGALLHANWMQLVGIVTLSCVRLFPYESFHVSLYSDIITRGFHS
ncbi:hypothetical protein FA13DRAFT_773994 [Coprinellus micaceus]|uniref:DUF6533 domain-containing protein n=1 Tax=Coprinellus micaceus TaxID=71717 RepID=A0A4Y7T355_COPMI|nr:hypothetical protein FA13DRAFT_773994 [Coprinellus micaceus]